MEKSNHTLNEAIARTQRYLFSIQYEEGYWWGELHSNATITAETVLLYKIMGVEKSECMAHMRNYLMSTQCSHGGWELFYGDGGDLSTTVEAYMALRLLGVPTTHPPLQKARRLILERGGITQARVFTKIHLALLGCYDWKGLPSLPPWIMMLPDSFPFNIYEMSSWARACTVPLIIVLKRKPFFAVNPTITMDELYVEGGQKHARFKQPLHGDWTDIFVMLDGLFKLMERFKLEPFREQGLKAAEKWVLEHQDETGDWGGIFPAMMNSLLALYCMGYDTSDPVIKHGLKALEGFSVQRDETCYFQSCISPVWDTALVMRALVDSGIPSDHWALQRAGQWLLDKQILRYGDWKVKNRVGKPGAWAFEFQNSLYPDVDDTATVVMALLAVELSSAEDERSKEAAICKAVKWIVSMQCKAGGWAAFDVDNDKAWLNAMPFGDLKAMIDPNTADVTARVVEMAGRLSCDGRREVIGEMNVVKRGVEYLMREQEKEGCWYGRWGVNYIYGTSGVLSALCVIEEAAAAMGVKKRIESGVEWIVRMQDEESGGWGETCRSYVDPSLKGKGDVTASQTAWAIMGLLAGGDALGRYEIPSIERGINYLLSSQLEDGTWNDGFHTGTGFPGHFYLKYSLYQVHFPLTALGRYRSALDKGSLCVSYHQNHV